MTDHPGGRGDVPDMHLDLPSVAVIVPTRNRAELLDGALRSLCNQDYPSDLFEIIVVDDGSTDSTAAAVQRVTDQTTVKLSYIAKPHSGLNASRNVGIRACDAPLVAFVDDDVVTPSTWLRSLAEGYLHHPSVGCFAGRILLQLEGPVPRCCGRESLGESELDLGEEEHDTQWAWGANFAVTRDALDQVGLFDEDLPLYGDETEWQHRLHRSGGRIIYLPDAFVMHRRTAADLAPLAMLRRRYRMGRSWPILGSHIDRHVSFVGGIWLVLSGLGHAISRRCWVGLLRSAYGVGHAHSAASLLFSNGSSDSLSWLPRRRNQHS